MTNDQKNALKLLHNLGGLATKDRTYMLDLVELGYVKRVRRGKFYFFNLTEEGLKHVRG